MAENLNWEAYQDQLRRLATLDYNYDEKIYHEAKDKTGWNIDVYRAGLAVEPAGPPVPGGAFAAVQNAIRLYQFPDPSLIRAVFDPEGPLPGRNMLLLAKFMGFHFSFGVRVTDVIDKNETNSEGQSVQTWGYAYRTLSGHFEVGQISFEVSKNFATGEVNFEIDAYSKAERIPNFLYRTGFRIFGRPLQRYFAHSSIRRLQQIARQGLSQAKKIN